jgi:hypothetical protein
MLKVKCKIINIDYEMIANRLLPDLFKDVSEDSKFSTKLANELLVKNKVTKSIAKSIIKIIPQKTKASITIDLITHNIDNIILSINEYFESNRIAMAVNDIKIKEINKAVYDMVKLEVLLNEIDYNSLITNVLPKILKSMSGADDKTGKLAQLLIGMEEVPNKMLNAALDVLPRKSKDDLLISILSIYKEDIVKYINILATQQQISAEVSEIKLENV